MTDTTELLALSIQNLAEALANFGPELVRAIRLHSHSMDRLAEAVRDHAPPGHEDNGIRYKRF